MVNNIATEIQETETNGRKSKNTKNNAAWFINITPTNFFY